ncbi:MAG: glycosyltransferase family 4 protein [Candidatus Omnitrophota bacterium]
MAKSILFISHNASRTGAPIQLLYFLTWLKKNTDITFQILLDDGGPLEPDFAACAPVSILNKTIPVTNYRLAKAFNVLGVQRIAKTIHRTLLRRKLIHANIGLICSNTGTNAEALEFLAGLQCPTITFVHESDFVMRYYIGIKIFEKVKKYTHHYTACSEAVRKSLVEHHGIPRDTIDLVYGFIPASSYATRDCHRLRARLCGQLNIPVESFIVCAAGDIDWRKGSDLFIQLARTVHTRQPNIPVYFIWIGGTTEGCYFKQLYHDIEAYDLERFVHFIEQVPNPVDYFAASDIITVVSREEPFSLVALEAASVGKPIVCFSTIGAAEAFVDDTCGRLAPYMDIEAMAEHVMHLLHDVDLRQQLGRHAAEKVRHQYDTEVGAPKLLSIIKKFLTQEIAE